MSATGDAFRDLHREVFTQAGGTEEEFDRWWATRQYEPGGLLIVDREEAEAICFWLDTPFSELEGVVAAGGEPLPDLFEHPSGECVQCDALREIQRDRREAKAE